MKSILAIVAIVAVTFVQSGCTAGAGVSVGHDGHKHGVTGKGSAEGGVSAGARAS